MNISPIDRDMLIRTVIGEAAHEPLQGQAGVVGVILNRLASGNHGSDVQDVVFAKNQFEPWSTRRSELLSYSPNSETYQRAAAVVDGVLNDEIKDPTGGATHFLNANVVRERRGGSLPDWAQGEGQKIGRHTFYAPEGKVQQVADGGAAPVADPAVLQQLEGGDSAQIEPGNIDLHSRPIVKNADGSISTVLSKSFNIDGREVLLPTISPSGTKLTDEGAIALYKKTGKHLGIFATPEAATAYAQTLHEDQAQEYLPNAAGPVSDPAILQQLNGSDVPSPPILSGIPGVDAVPATPILPGREIGVGQAFLQGFTSNEQESLRALAQSLYPNEPIDKAISRFGQEGGVLYHVADDGKRYRVNPEGWSIGDVLNNLAKGAGAAIPATAGAAVGIATAPAALAGPGGLAASLSATSTAAGAGEYAREKLGDVMLGDASTGGVSPLQIASEAGGALVGQGAGTGFGKLATRGAVRDIARYDPVDTARAYADAAAQGISLTPAEATGIASLKAQQKRLLNTMETADTMSEFMSRRDTEVRTAWNGFMDSISTAADAENVGKLARETAGSVLSDMRTVLQKRAQPLYDAAFGTVRDPQGKIIGYQKKIPLTPVLESLLKRPVMKDALERAATLAKNEGISFNPAAVPDARGWDFIKQGLDDIIDSPAAKNERTGGMNNYGRIVSGIKRDLLSEIDSINPDYASARSVYSTGAEDLSGAMQSALKIVADTKDTKILDAARHIFDPRTRSPEMVIRLRGAIEGKDPDAWQAVKRLYIQNETIDALRRTEQGGDVINPAGKLYKAFTDDRLQANLKVAMTPDEWKNMTDLLVVFKRASSVPYIRSDTAFNLWAKESERAAAEGGLSKLLKNLNPVQAARNVAEWKTEKNLDRNAARMAQIVTSNDPQAVIAMRELRRLSPWDRRWLIIFGHLLGQGGSAAASTIIPEPDFEPGRQVSGSTY